LSAVLVIAGTDSSGGAGLTRDVATLAHFEVEALCAVTAVTAQTDTAVTAVAKLPAPLVSAQIASALATGRVRASKIGMLAASSGGELLDTLGRAALCAQLLPRTTLLTPNIDEAAALLGEAPAISEDELIAQGRALCALGPTAVLMKGGHARGTLATDWLIATDGSARSFSAARVARELRGTGCALASAIAAGLAAGLALAAACEQAKRYVSESLQRRA
jgi:hydroxymethylpyrimidine/phosphomethylpyrimidine kinase